FAALVQAAHRPLEDDVVEVVLVGEGNPRQPDDEDHQPHEQDQGGEPHQGVVGVLFHQAFVSALVVAAALPRGPGKYSRIQGWSACSSARTGAVAATCLSAMTATRSVIS